MTKLSFTLPLQPNETLPSYCSRTAALNGIETASEFSSHFGFDFGRLSEGWHSDIKVFSRLVGKEPRQLQRSLIVQSRKIVEAAGAAFSREFIDPNRCRICPACALSDMGSKYYSHRAYGRVEWMVSFVHTCPEHRIPLIRVEGSRKNFADFSRQLRTTIIDLESHANSSRRNVSTCLQNYVIHRLSGKITYGIWLDNFALQAAAHFTELLGAVLRDGPEPALEDFTEIDWIEVAEIGFGIASMGPNDIAAALGRFFDIELTARKIRTSVFFGRLPDELLSRADLPGYLDLARFVENVVRERYPQMVSDLPA